MSTERSKRSIVKGLTRNDGQVNTFTGNRLTSIIIDSLRIDNHRADGLALLSAAEHQINTLDVADISDDVRIFRDSATNSGNKLLDLLIKLECLNLIRLSVYLVLEA